MDEMLPVNNELQTFITSIRQLAELEDEFLTDEALKEIMNNVDGNLTPEVISQTINQIIENLDMQCADRTKAKDAINAIKQLINELVYGEATYSGNKKILLDHVVGSIFNIFDQVLERYHLYSINLPMTVAEGAQVPSYAHDTDAAADLYAMENVALKPHSLGNKIRTGIKIQLPEGWLAMILPRSSMGAKTPLRLSNSVGLIDSGYRGELGVLYDNISDDEYTINAGDRIAQLLVMPSHRFQAQVIDNIEDSDRGEGGFGSTGK